MLRQIELNTCIHRHLPLYNFSNMGLFYKSQWYNNINALPISTELHQTIQPPVSRCTYQSASNFDPSATNDDGSCQFINACPADVNMDGIVGVADLIAFMAAYGSFCEKPLTFMIW